jgi:hypothetical protein
MEYEKVPLFYVFDVIVLGGVYRDSVYINLTFLKNNANVKNQQRTFISFFNKDKDIF